MAQLVMPLAKTVTKQLKNVLLESIILK